MDEVIAVGGIAQNYQRMATSLYGSELDVVAPGEGIASIGLDRDEWNLTGIAGTSFAAPQVAGVAALMLSKNPGMTNQLVRDIIEQTAQKINNGAYPYASNSAHPNGTWHEQMGYGLVDAHTAVIRSTPNTNIFNISGPTKPALNSMVAYSIQSSLPSGVQFTGWEVMPGPHGTTYYTSSTTSPTLNIFFYSRELFTIKVNFAFSSGATYFSTINVDLR